MGVLVTPEEQEMTTGIPEPAPPFDTQRAVENLKAGGFSGAQAAALTRTLVDATANLVTKADLKAGLDELKGLIRGLQQGPIRDLQRSDSEMKESIREMKESIREMKGSIREMKGSTREMKESISGFGEALGGIRVEIARAQAAMTRMMLFVAFGVIGAVVTILRWVLPQ